MHATRWHNVFLEMSKARESQVYDYGGTLSSTEHLLRKCTYLKNVDVPDGQNTDTPVLSDAQCSLIVNKSPTTVVIQQKDRWLPPEQVWTAPSLSPGPVHRETESVDSSQIVQLKYKNRGSPHPLAHLPQQQC